MNAFTVPDDTILVQGKEGGGGGGDGGSKLFSYCILTLLFLISYNCVMSFLGLTKSGKY